jgi:hypothetical protein
MFAFESQRCKEAKDPIAASLVASKDCATLKKGKEMMNR